MTTQSFDAATLVNQRVDDLERAWLPRQQMVKKWYELIQLKNDLAQDNMESVIGNDPRSSYNIATWLLTPKTWSINSLKAGLSDEEIHNVTAYEQLVERELLLAMRSRRGRLQGSYLSQAVKLLVATGWICLVFAPTQPRWTVNAWHPMTVYPHYAPDGTMSELARKWSVTDSQANTMIFMEGWIPPTQRFTSNVVVRQWWVQTPTGVLMATTMNNHLPRPLGPTMFSQMPIYCQPAGGLPDDGTIVTGDTWRGEVGQSIVASVLDLQKNYDRMMSYMQQLLRDTANPKWIERGDGAGVVKPEDINKRGVVWKVGLGEDIWAVQPPGAPVDLRTHEFDIRTQIQRGTFQDASFGGADASAFLMANITDSTRQLLQPFVDTLRDANGELLTRSALLAQSLGQTIGGAPIPDVPDIVTLDFEYDVQIPGDFLQRSNSARILNPNFRVSQETLMSMQFPEIKDAFDERLRLTTEDVAQSEMMLGIKQIKEFRQAAVQANLAGDGESESLLTRAADRLEATLLGPEPGANEEQRSRTFRDIVRAGS